VKITSSKGTNAQLAAAMNVGLNDLTDDPYLDLTTAPDVFEGAAITVKVSSKEPGSNKVVDGIFINAYDGEGNDLDLAKVTVVGNLTGIDVGDEDLSTPAVKSILASTWGPVEEFEDFAISSEIHGNIGTITVNYFDGFILSVEDYTSDLGTVIGTMTVKKSIASLFGEDVGHIQVGTINKLTVKDTFFGPADSGYVGNGLIEAKTINVLNIKSMVHGARIELADSLAEMALSRSVLQPYRR
jgi:hypothetical protein